MNYRDFIEARRHSQKPQPRELLWAPSGIFDFQRHLVSLALGEARYALFADTGMGKTIMQLTWAQNVHLITIKPVLVLAPLAVTYQTKEEAIKWGIDDCDVSRNGKVNAAIVVTNYEQLPKFNPNDFGGIVCDESGILKSIDGVIRSSIVDFCRKMPYRLLCSATPSPNDFTELGSSSEALGIMGHVDMLNKFFRNQRANSNDKRHYGKAPEWRFRGHSEIPFWQWVSSWSRCIRRPSDVGFSDDGYNLPGLQYNYHKLDVPPPPGMLFAMPSNRLPEQRQETKRTTAQRCEKVAELVDHDKPFIAWCHYNPEGDLLRKLIPDAVEISGKDSDDAKLEKFQAFTSGQARGLITKPKIGAWGLNFQHCSHMTYFPSHSYELFYQSIRRCWRYGQKSEVITDIVYTPGEQKILDNMRDKSRKAERMYNNLVEQMNNAIRLQEAQFNYAQDLPQWL